MSCKEVQSLRGQSSCVWLATCSYFLPFTISCSWLTCLERCHPHPSSPLLCLSAPVHYPKGAPQAQRGVTCLSAPGPCRSLELGGLESQALVSAPAGRQDQPCSTVSPVTPAPRGLRPAAINSATAILPDVLLLGHGFTQRGRGSRGQKVAVHVSVCLFSCSVSNLTSSL